MTIQAIDHDPILNQTKISGVSQTTKNRLYMSDFLTELDEDFYFDKFVELMDFTILMLQKEVFGKTKEGGAPITKPLTRPSAVQNLYWMMCNGLETYDEVVAAVKLHEKAYNDRNRTFTCGDDYKTFKDFDDGEGNLCFYHFDKKAKSKRRKKYRKYKKNRHESESSEEEESSESDESDSDESEA